MPPKPPAKKVAERQAMTHFFSPDRNAEKVAQKAQETLQLAENADRLRVRLAEYLGQFHKDSRNLMVLVIAAKATHAYLERRKFDRKRWSEMVEHWYMEEGRKSMSWAASTTAAYSLAKHKANRCGHCQRATVGLYFASIRGNVTQTANFDFRVLEVRY